MLIGCITIAQCIVYEVTGSSLPEEQTCRKNMLMSLTRMLPMLTYSNVSGHAHDQVVPVL